jgi:EAL domain-containing protein (putative c-di-GMP-specific phosphodiesterase class I)
LAPQQFLAIAKKTKVYHQITQKMIEDTFLMLEKYPYEFSVNIAIEDVLNAETSQFIIEKIKASQHTNRIIFEFVESDAIKEENKIFDFINEIKRYGAKIAIDDFGSGYSNFATLINMQADFIKVDGSLITKIDTDPSSLMVVESIVDFAKKLQAKVIAEHVYSSTVLSKVQALGIEYSQGFYIDKPRIEIK